jgi:hypothetical protein
LADSDFSEANIVLHLYKNEDEEEEKRIQMTSNKGMMMTH